MELEVLRANLLHTLVPVLVGAVATAVPLLGTPAAIYPLTAAAVTYVFYAVIRIAETKYPQFGRLHGRKRVDTGAATAGQPGTQVELGDPA